MMAGEARWEWEAQCDAVLCEAIAALGRYNGSLSADWRALETRGPLTVSRFHGNDGGSLRLVGTGYIHGRLEDIARGLYCDVDDDLVSCEAVLSRAPVLDGAVLHALETRGPETPFRFAGVKWCATQADDVDYELLTFERMGVTLDSDNTELAYHVVYSIPDRPEWPTDAQLRASSSIFRQRRAPEGIKRLEPFVLCYLYRRVGEDLVLCYILGEYWGDDDSQLEAEQLLIHRICMVARAVKCCEAKILTKMVEHCRDTPEQVSKTCLRCRVTRRTVSDPLRLCGVCRKSVCKACVEFKTTCRIDPDARTAETEAICTRCLVRSNISIDATGPGNAHSNASGSHRPRRDFHRPNHAHRHAATELRPRERIPTEASRIRRQASTPTFVPHTYNYDNLLNRASSGSWTSSTSSKGVTDRQVRLVTTHEQKKESFGESVKSPTVNRRLSLGGSSSLSYDDLYLVGGRNAASGEAERRYQLHLERNRRLSQEDPERPRHQSRNQARSSSQPQLAPTKHGKPERAPPVSFGAGGVSAPAPNTKETSSEAPKTKAIRDFYRDLYADM